MISRLLRRGTSVGVVVAAVVVVALPGVAAGASRQGITKFTPTSGAPGTAVTISGSGFTGVSAVSFGGTPASSFTVKGKSVVAVVADGTVSGPITVSAGSGLLTSTASFTALGPVDLTSCAENNGVYDVPIGDGAYLQATWQMASSIFLKLFLTGQLTTLTVNGTAVKSANKLWDNKGHAGPSNSWETTFGYALPTKLANAGASLSATFHVVTTKAITDGYQNYAAGVDLWAATPCKVQAAPQVQFANASPLSGPARMPVTITGQHLDYVNAVTFNGTPATFIVDDPQTITARVPVGATSGPITLVEPGLTSPTSQSDFTVSPDQPLTVSSFDPESGPLGTEVTIHGTGLLRVTAVKFNGPVVSIPEPTSDTQLTVTVVPGAVTGPITVKDATEMAASADNFTYNPLTSWDSRDGSVVVHDPSAATTDTANLIAVDASGDLLVAGQSQGANASSAAPEIERLLPDGSLDTSFGTNGVVVGGFAGLDYFKASSLLVQSDGKILLAGTTGYNGATAGDQFAIVRYNADGTPDGSFGSSGVVVTTFWSQYTFGSPCGVQHPKIALRPNGTILLAGKACNHLAFVQYLANGTTDPDFGTSGLLFGTVGSISDVGTVIIQGDGKAVVVGGVNPASAYEFFAERIGTDGTLDPTWGSSGYAFIDGTAPNSANHAIFDGSGRLVIAGEGALARLTSTGALDTTFATNGVFNPNTGNVDSGGFALEPNGKLLVAGDNYVSRFLANGTLDGSYGGGGTLTAEYGAFWEDAVIGPGGYLYTVGYSTADGFAVGRYATG